MFVSKLAHLSVTSARLQSSGSWRGLQTSNILRAAIKGREVKSFTPSAPSRGLSLRESAVAGVSAVGLGLLCLQGAYSSNTPAGTVAWDPPLREKIRTSFLYLGGTVMIPVIVASSVNACNSTRQLLMRSPCMSLFVTLGGATVLGVLAKELPQDTRFSCKHAAWVGQGVLLGLAFIPMVRTLRGPVNLLTRGMWYSAGMVAGLSAVGTTAKNETFFTRGGQVGMGLGIIFMAAVGNLLLPVKFAQSGGLPSILFCSTLVLFAYALVENSKVMVRQAKTSGGGQAEDQMKKILDIFNFWKFYRCQLEFLGLIETKK